MIEVEELAMPEVRLLRTRRFGDERGTFEETWRQSWAEELGITELFVQHNHSYSRDRFTMRGLHFQLAPEAQGKLVRVLRGAVQDVAVDIRKDSPTFGQHVSTRLDATTPAQLYIPPGFAHGFLTLEPHTDVQYQVTRYWSRDHERGLRYDDPEIGIAWEGEVEVINDRDSRHPPLAGLATA
ncbi:MAG: dTDP-4-dehydrorhamnose 3,5-epimerase [Myxococcota bacterium]